LTQLPINCQCDSTYKIKTVKSTGSLAHTDNNEEEHPPPKKRKKKEQSDITPAPPISARDFGILTDYINTALQQGPEGVRAAEREANRFAREHGLTPLRFYFFLYKKPRFSRDDFYAAQESDTENLFPDASRYTAIIVVESSG
jgi:hypothetical protein